MVSKTDPISSWPLHAVLPGPSVQVAGQPARPPTLLWGTRWTSSARVIAHPKAASLGVDSPSAPWSRSHWDGWSVRRHYWTPLTPLHLPTPLKLLDHFIDAYPSVFHLGSPPCTPFHRPRSPIPPRLWLQCDPDDQSDIGVSCKELQYDSGQEKLHQQLAYW